MRGRCLRRLRSGDRLALRAWHTLLLRPSSVTTFASTADDISHRASRCSINDPPVATMPRSKKYDWSDKRDLCYRLYAEEEKSLPQIQEYFAQALGVAENQIPSYVLSFHPPYCMRPVVWTFVGQARMNKH